MMELGAVFAVPHIRGGGELGNECMDAGRALNRQIHSMTSLEPLGGLLRKV